MVKSFVFVVLTAVVMSCSSSYVVAQDSGTGNTTRAKVDWNRAVKNYIQALRSENAGVRQSAEAFFDKHKGSKEFETVCIEPLIALLNNDASEEIRKIAARLLVESGNTRGINAVEQASRTDDSKEVVEFCQWLLNTPEKNKL